MLLRLVYVSTLADGIGKAELDAIATRSARANIECVGDRPAGARDKDRVCQVLDGPTDAVDRLYETIRANPRHRDVLFIDRREVSEPHFGRWGMARRRMVDIVSLALTL